MGIPWRRALWPMVAALMLALAWAGTAAAAPVIATGPGSAQVKIGNDRFLPGGTITLEGSGFQPHIIPGSGDPVLAVKINGGDLPAGWSYGGDDAIDAETLTGEDIAGFVVQADGTFDGWIKVGPSQAPWDLHLRFLGGSFGTDSPAVGASKLVPMSFTGDIAIVERVTTGFLNNATPAQFFPGATLPGTGGQLTVRGVGFTTSSTVTAALDGDPVTLSGTTTVAADGTFDATAPIPGALSAGNHTLQVTDGAITETRTIRIVPHTATVLTPKVRPGGLIAVGASGYVGINGSGQGIALMLAGTTVINYDAGNPASVCPKADNAGSALLTGTVPTSTTTGTTSLNVLGGRNCIATAPPIVTDPFPRPFATTVEVNPNAPAVTPASTTVTAGTKLGLTAAGFAPNETATVLLDGAATGVTLTANAAGAASGVLPVRGSTAAGTHVIVLTAPSGGAAAKVQVATAPAPTASITGGSVVPGGNLAVALTGFLRDDAQGGQKVAFKIDGAGDVLACIQTDATGAGSGSVPIPADIAPGDHVLNVLAGSACGEGAQSPGRSLQASFAIAAPGPAPAPAPVPAPGPGTAPTPTPKKKVVAPALRNVTLVNKGKRARIVLRKATPARTVVTIRTAAKVRLAPRAKRAVVTLGKGVVKAKGRIATISLTAKGKRYLAKRPKNAKVRVKVVRAPKGGVRSTQTLVLRVTR